jgi:hypothetical protein
MNALVTTDSVSESQALVAANPLDVSPEAFRGALARRGENRKALMVWVRDSLVSGVDFGRIHVVGKSSCSKGNQCDNPRHFSNDCLFKPGDEKIAGMLGVTPTFPTLHKYEDAALSGVELKQIILRCHMVDSSGRIVADGIGARSLEQDHGDINKSLKMCAKSAHIDATLRMAGLSEVFTQDLDQMKADGRLDQDTDGPHNLTPAQAFGKSLVEALEAGIEARVIEVWDAGMKDKAAAQDAWELLTSEERKAINAILERAKGPPAKKGMTQSSKW